MNQKNAPLSITENGRSAAAEAVDHNKLRNVVVLPRGAPELMVTKALQPSEKECFRKEGGRVPVLIGVARFEESGNQGIAFVLDLTERKAAEAERAARRVAFE